MKRHALLVLAFAIAGALAPGQAPWRSDRITFVANTGQWPGDARFVARRGEMLAVVESDRMRIHLGSTENASAAGSFALVVENATGDAGVEGLEPAPGMYNFFYGNDPGRWRTGVRGFARVVHREIRPGIDLQWREHDGMLEYDLLVAPGADLSDFVVRAEGAKNLKVGDGNELLMETSAGTVRQTAPVAWQESPEGGRTPTRCRWRLFDGDRYGFEVDDRDPGSRLVVDPGLLWATYLGGVADDLIRAIDLADEQPAFGEPECAGEAQSLAPPTTMIGAGGGWDAFVARFRPDASGPGSNQLVWMTFLGGSGADRAVDLAFGPGGSILLSGSSAGGAGVTGFPTTAGAFQTASAGGSDAFVSKLDAATGANLQWSTSFGGTGHEFAHAMFCFGDGSVRLVGTTNSTGLPTTPGAFQAALAGGRDAFVASLDPSFQGSAQLRYLTYLGGSGDEGAPPPLGYQNIVFKDLLVSGYALDPSGQITVAGRTTSADFPMQNPMQAFNHPGSYDLFVCRLEPTRIGAQQLAWSTYLGGTGAEDVGGLSVDATGRITIAGSTTSAGFPVTPATAFQPLHASAANGLPDGFVTRLDPALPGPAQLVSSTFLGGAGSDSVVAGLEMENGGFDETDAMLLAGTTDSVASPPYFPTTRGALYHLGVSSPFAAPVQLAWAARIDLDQPVPANQLIYSTLFGSPSGGQVAFDIAQDRDGGAFVGGATLSGGIPMTPGTYQPAYAGGTCGWAAWLDLLPIGVSRHGDPTPGPSGRPVIGVRSQPYVGNGGFAFTCEGGPPFAAGAFGVSLSLLIPAVQVVCGAAVHITLNEDLVFATATSTDAFGRAEVAIPIPAVPALAGISVNSQFLWFEPAGGCSSSAALVATIQP